MGEAKRRKAADPNYGKSNSSGKGFSRKTVQLGISVSQKSGNYIVYCKKSGFWIDSAIAKEDAELVKAAVQEIADIDPPKSFSQNGWLKWLKQYWSQIPEVDARTWVVDSSSVGEAIDSLLSGAHPSDIASATETTFFSKVD